MQAVPLTADYVQGAADCETADDGLRIWRCRLDDRILLPDEGLLARLDKAAGVRLRFRTNSTALRLGVAASDTPELIEKTFDLRRGDDLIDAKMYELGERHIAFSGLSGNDAVYELWLPVMWDQPLSTIEIDDGADIAPAEDDRPRWITYGSSITHCRRAHSPSRTWPAIVARKHGLHLTSLGLGGQCHGDTMIARQIRDTPADVISIKYGVNIYGAASLSPRTFEGTLIGMIKIIREKHPETPMIICSPIVSPDRETTPNAVNLTLEKMREYVADAVDRLQQAGDENIIYVNGLDLFGPDLVEEHLPDLLHPDGDGYEITAENFSRLAMTKLGF